MDYRDIEWFALETKRSFCHFEIASKYFILDSFVDHDGYSISSKGFLPTVVDIMVKVRRGGREKIPLVQGKEKWLRFREEIPTFKVRETQVRW